MDAGSRLLLKTVAQKLPLEDINTVHDAGCGTGVLGLSLAKRLPQARVSLGDRDALAAAFTAKNAALNQIKNIRVSCSLLLEGVEEGSLDLLLCNFPAKAGAPVLQDFLSRAPGKLRSGGTLALVIVHTLAPLCRQYIEEAGGRITAEESSKMHTVYHLIPPAGLPEEKPSPPGDPLAPYIRHKGTFRLNRVPYPLETAWNLPDFDSLSWKNKTAAKVLDGHRFSDIQLFWAPGQGHLPQFLSTASRTPRHIFLAGPDLLQLLISQRNLQSSSIPITLLPLAAPELLSQVLPPASLDLFWMDYAPVSRTHPQEALKAAVQKILRPGGYWAAAGKSADLGALFKNRKGFTTQKDRRYHGWRGVLFQKHALPKE